MIWILFVGEEVGDCLRRSGFFGCFLIYADCSFVSNGIDIVFVFTEFVVLGRSWGVGYRVYRRGVGSRGRFFVEERFS